MRFPRVYFTAIIFFLASTAVATSPNATLEIYKVDPEDNSISLRLRPLQPDYLGIDEYKVLIDRDIENVHVKREYGVSNELECISWGDSVCFEKITIPKNIELGNTRDSAPIRIQIRGYKAERIQKTWTNEFTPGFYAKGSNKPVNCTHTSNGHGMVTLTWHHPLFPQTKIEQFHISIHRKAKRLLQPISTPPGGVDVLPMEKERREYTKTLSLFTASEYEIGIRSQGMSDYGDPETFSFWVPSEVVFASRDLRMRNNGTLIELEIPAVVNATDKTFVQIIMKGMLTCAGTNIEREWIVREEPVVDDGSPPINEKFDANETVPMNCSLNHGTDYEIKVKIIEEWFNATDTLQSTYPISFPAIDSSGLIMPGVKGSDWKWLGIVAFFIAIIGLAVLFLVCRRNGWIIFPRTSKQDSIPTTVVIDHHKAFTSPGNSTPPSTRIRLSTQQSTPDVVPSNSDSNSIKIEDFEEHVKEALASGLLDSQYQKFPRGLIKPHDYGLLPENADKNRYKNLIAYDETRVILRKNGDDPCSDYINANYIRGYGNDRAYIATQGPKPQTVRDFWRMIWENDVHVICMLANVKEGGKIKCEQYWPEVKSKAKYGDVLIENMSHEVFADYTFRYFRLTCKKVQREVTHLHYTGWPDHGIPTYTQSLVSYLKKLQDTPSKNGPVVVHCSAGVGRTGTIILCDICLKQAAAEKTIDVLGVTERIRNNRANMVDSAQQYLLAHLTIVESMVPVPTQMPCNKVLESRINELRKHLPSDIQRLNDTVWQDRALHALAAPTRPTPEDVANNGISAPARGSLVAAKLAAFNGENNSINAVSADGVKMKKQYLASCLPSASTLGKFWELIHERKIELVVILQRAEKEDPTFCDIVPDKSILVPVPHLNVERKTILIKEDHFLIDKLLLTDTRKEEGKPQPVTVVTCNGWGCGVDKEPPSPDAMISLWQASEKISRKESPTLVLCHDGVTACGLYLALSFLLERMSVERECDIISAVRAVRRSNPDFVQSLKQFDYLYDAAVDYIKCFETYANFS